MRGTSLLLLAALAADAHAGLLDRFAVRPPEPPPRLTALFPMGCQRGTAAELSLAGYDLEGVEGVRFTHPGLRGELVKPDTKPEPKADPKAPKPAKRPTPPGGPTLAVRVEVAADVPPGQYDLRVVGRGGVSNARFFSVGTRPELSELEPNDEALAPEPFGGPAGGFGLVSRPGLPRAQRVTLGAAGVTVNGVIGSPTDVDYTVFAGKGGERVLIHCAASSIESRARPLVELFDPAGKRIAQNRNYAGTDALVDATLTTTGDYFVRLSAFAYQQGSAEDYYRLTIGQKPWIDAVVPQVVEPGKSTQVTVIGRFLPGGERIPGDPDKLERVTATVTAPAKGEGFRFRGTVPPPMALLDAFEFRLGESNPLPLFLADGPVTLERDTVDAPNDTPKQAQELTVPCEVAGCIDRKNDRDFYRFRAKKGEVFQIDLLGERLGHPTDLALRVRDDKGAELAGELDDDADSLHPVTFFSRSSDPAPHTFTAPADGDYTLFVSALDSPVSCGPRCGYWLRVRKPTPDFRAVAMARSRDWPATVTLTPGGVSAFDVFVHRTGGFTGPVTLAVSGLPKGVTAVPTPVNPGSRWGTLLLRADKSAAGFTGAITITATATEKGQTLTHAVRPASIMWGIPNQPRNEIPTLTRLDEELLLAVRPGQVPMRLAVDRAKAVHKSTADGKATEKPLAAAGVIVARPGDKLTIPVDLVWLAPEARANPVSLAAESTHLNQIALALITGSNQPLSVPKDKTRETLTVEVRANAALGLHAVLIRGEVQQGPNRDRRPPLMAVAYAEPVLIRVVPLQVAKLAVQGPANNQLKLGQTAALTVKVQRLADYAGPLTVRLVLPKDLAGVTAAPVTLAEGETEVKLSVAVAADAKPGALSNLAVEAVAAIPGEAGAEPFKLVHEAKVTLTIVK